MKHGTKLFITGFVSASVIFSSTSVLAETTKKIDAIFGRVRLVVEGKALSQETILYNGTTYVPIRAAAEVLGKDVTFDSATQTAYIGSSSKSVKQAPTPTTAPVSKQTIGQKNALSSAKAYLNYSAFSYSGLIKQLEYEKYSKDDATYAADNCGADWNEQAAKCAKTYLAFSSFSREGLIEQLEYEGFTSEQAAYGVKANGY